MYLASDGLQHLMRRKFWSFLSYGLPYWQTVYLNGGRVSDVLFLGREQSNTMGPYYPAS